MAVTQRVWTAMLAVMSLVAVACTGLGNEAVLAGASSALVRAEPSGSTVATQGAGIPAATTRDVAGVFADLETFWTQSVGADFTAPSAGYALIDTSDPQASGLLCGGNPDSLRGNAFYCPGTDGIVIDAGALTPVLLNSYGVGGLAAAISHEFGHAVQAKVGPTLADQDAQPERFPRILIEAQADCAAGAYLRWAVDGTAPRLQLPRDQLLRSIGPLLDFRDTAGAQVDDPLAHGLGLDRLRFMLAGFHHGPGHCRTMTPEALALTLGRPGLAVGGAPRFPDDAALTTGAEASMASFVGQLPASPPAVSAEERTVANSLGQFATAATIVRAAGQERFGTAVGAACFTGAWTSATYGAPSHSPTDLGSWAGDADEAMDLIRLRPGADFDELAAFAAGFDSGLSACQ